MYASHESHAPNRYGRWYQSLNEHYPAEQSSSYADEFEGNEPAFCNDWLADTSSAATGWSQGGEDGDSQLTPEEEEQKNWLKFCQRCCIFSAYMGPQFSEEYHQFVVQLHPVTYADLCSEDLSTIITSATTFHFQSDGILQLMCTSEQIKTVMKCIFFVTFENGTVTVELDQREPDWSETEDGTPFYFPSRIHQASFVLSNAHIRKQLCSQTVTDQTVTARERSVLLADVPADVNSAFLRLVFPVCESCFIQDKDRSAVVGLASRERVMQHLMCFTELHINGQPIAMSATNNFLPEEAQKAMQSIGLNSESIHATTKEEIFKPLHAILQRIKEHASNKKKRSPSDHRRNLKSREKFLAKQAFIPSLPDMPLVQPVIRPLMAAAKPTPDAHFDWDLPQCPMPESQRQVLVTTGQTSESYQAPVYGYESPSQPEVIPYSLDSSRVPKEFRKEYQKTGQTSESYQAPVYGYEPPSQPEVIPSLDFSRVPKEFRKEYKKAVFEQLPKGPRGGKFRSAKKIERDNKRIEAFQSKMKMLKSQEQSGERGPSQHPLPRGDGSDDVQASPRRGVQPGASHQGDASVQPVAGQNPRTAKGANAKRAGSRYAKSASDYCWMPRHFYQIDRRVKAEKSQVQNPDRTVNKDSARLDPSSESLSTKAAFDKDAKEDYRVGLKNHSQTASQIEREHDHVASKHYSQFGREENRVGPKDQSQTERQYDGVASNHNSQFDTEENRVGPKRHNQFVEDRPENLYHRYNDSLYYQSYDDSYYLDRYLYHRRRYESNFPDSNGSRHPFI